MNITDKRIDSGTPFDWGKVSADYAKYRDIYPSEFYQKILGLHLCQEGQKVLDLGTGTGVLPRNMYKYGTKWTGIDISSEQIAQAKKLSQGMDIDYLVSSTENANFPDKSFDIITACQCFWYFKHEIICSKLAKMLKPNGRLLILYMAWLPFEDMLAGKSEQLILKYSPNWSGAGEYIHPIDIPKCYSEKFKLVYHDEFKLNVPFTREAWHGRIKACRGIGASLSEEQIALWEKEHKQMLQKFAPDKFTILHYAAIAELQKLS